MKLQALAAPDTFPGVTGAEVTALEMLPPADEPSTGSDAEDIERGRAVVPASLSVVSLRVAFRFAVDGRNANTDVASLLETIKRAMLSLLGAL